MRGYTAVQVAVVVLMVAVLVALLLVLARPPSVTDFTATRTECMNNVRYLVALLTIAPEYPKKEHGGVTLILWLAKNGEFDHESLFCPGDKTDTLDGAGGIEAFGSSLDVSKKGKYDHLSSYAGRDQTNEACRAIEGSTKLVIMICDDSEDHHGGRGFVVGLTGGAVKWRDKVDDWKLRLNTPVKVGPGSIVPELTCLLSD